MEVFISWSGVRSRHIAESFQSWLGLVIQSVEPWISPDIEKGLRWSVELSEKLEKARIGIICLTKENIPAPWLLFEAGALSKIKADHVCTFLYDLSPGDIEFPLAQFQHTENKKDDIFKLVYAINNASAKVGEKPLTDANLKKSFDTYWGQLEEALQKTPPSNVQSKKPMREEKDVLQEILETMRYQHFLLEDIRKSVGSKLPKAIDLEFLKQAVARQRLNELSSKKEDPWPAIFDLLNAFAEKWGKPETQTILLKGIESTGAVGTLEVKKADK